MSRKRIVILISVSVVVASVGIGIALRVAKKGVPRLNPAITIEGSVLKQDTDPSKRTPIPDVTITATRGETEVVKKTDPTGYFNMWFNGGIDTGADLTLTFVREGYKTIQMTPSNPGDQLYIVQMEPLSAPNAMRAQHVQAPAKVTSIKDVRVRYSFKDQSTIPVGAIAKEFLAPNKGNIPCQNHKPCSPDGKWKATQTILPIDTEPGNEFRNVRVSCIAGPCHFLTVDPGMTEHAARLKISVLNWSDTAAFLVEGDVIRTMVTNIVRQSYPFIIGNTMSFALPPSSQTVSIEANLDGKLIVFPLGPALNISWADCNVDTSTSGDKTYRCQLKPGYQF
ncbi:MAG: carboxypeptidase-like regulatory domain-containing protein [Bryobacteraceae bacterium]